jgi:hypothetical protein
MATAAPALVHPTLLDTRPRRFRPASEIAAIPAAAGSSPQELAEGTRSLPLRIGPTPHRLDVAECRTLTGVAATIEGSGGALLSLHEPELAPELRRRSSLVTLRRRADKRGKTLLLRFTSPAARALAESAGWRTEPLPPDSRITRPSADAPAPARPGYGEDESRRPARRVPHAASLAAFVPAVRLPRLTRPGVALPRAHAERMRSLGAGVPVPRRALPLGGAVGCVALALAVVAYPSATVTLTPVSESWTVDVPIVVDPSAKKADPATGRLPGRAISREVQETATAPATGRKNVPDAKASGEVVLLNRSAQPVSVPKGSIVTAGAVKFATQSDVTVSPSRAAATTQSFGMATVRVLAVTGGVSGNVDRNQINRIEGPAANALTVQNNAPTRGGTDRPISYVTEEDRRKLQEGLTRTLSDRLAQQVKADLPPADKETVVPWAGQNPSVVEATFSKNVDEEAQTFGLTLKLRYGATAFANDAYNGFVRQAAAAGAKDLKPGFAVAPDSVQPEPPAVAGVENGVVRLTGRVRATATSRVDLGALRAALAGRPAADAHAHLAQLPGSTGYELRSRGPLPGRLPFFGWQIGVQTKG